MRIYRVRLVDGREREIAADRVTADATSTTFEVFSQGVWILVLHLPTAGIASIARRVTEVDGRWSWVKTDPVRASAASRPGAAGAEEVGTSRG